MEFRFNKTTNGLEPVSTHKYENMTLNNILAISKDSSNNYLFGTSYGLIKYTSETSYQLFNAKNGFLNNTVHAILKNSPDNFWLSTNLGLINFDTKRTPVHFSLEESTVLLQSGQTVVPNSFICLRFISISCQSLVNNTIWENSLLGKKKLRC